jgi:hypothetical protein
MRALPKREVEKVVLYYCTYFVKTNEPVCVPVTPIFWSMSTKSEVLLTLVSNIVIFES